MKYTEKYFSDEDEFNLIYNIDTLYNRFLKVLSNMESSIPYNRYTFERDFGIFGENGRFLNVSENSQQVLANHSSFENYGLSNRFQIGTKKLSFILRIKIAMIRTAAVITDTSRRVRDSYLYREWSSEEQVRLFYREKRPVVTVTFLTPEAVVSGNESYCSSVEYGFVGSISRFRSQNYRIPKSLRRCINIQYGDAIYMYVEEKLLGRFGMDLEVLRRMIQLIDRDENDSNKFKKMKLDHPFKTDQEELFNFTKVKNSFE